jgi:hypothetical protein
MGAVDVGVTDRRGTVIGGGERAHRGERNARIQRFGLGQLAPPPGRIGQPSLFGAS